MKCCCITHGVTAASGFKLADLSIKHNLNAALQPKQILVQIRIRWCVFVNTHTKCCAQGQAPLQQELSALLMAELHKGGVISFRITQIKHALTVQIDFLEWTQTFINNDFAGGYFYHSVGIKCFCQCTGEEQNHLCILLSISQKQALQSYFKTGYWPSFFYF